MQERLTQKEEVKVEVWKTPSVGKQQNKKVLEEDGIKCFDLEDGSEDLRMSLESQEEGININESL